MATSVSERSIDFKGTTLVSALFCAAEIRSQEFDDMRGSTVEHCLQQHPFLPPNLSCDNGNKRLGALTILRNPEQLPFRICHSRVHVFPSTYMSPLEMLVKALCPHRQFPKLQKHYLDKQNLIYTITVQR